MARRTYLFSLAANVIGAGTVAIVLALAIPVYPGGITYAKAMFGFVIVGGGLVSAIAVFGFFHVRWLTFRNIRWLTENRDPTTEEIERLAALPRLAATVAFSYWVFGTPGTLVLLHLVVGYQFTFELVWKAMFIYSLGAFIATTLVYVAVEASIRPIVNAVLPADTELWPRTIGLSPRLLLAWLCVAGAPLITIAAVLTSLNDQQRVLAVPAIITATVLTTVIGLFVFIVVGRTLTSPLQRLRGALRSVAGGDLSWHLEIDEAGEIGQLQAGFNQMVAGLRERERMRDVFGRHVGTDVARLAMETEFGQGGSICEATVLFVDIIGSTGLAERQEPDEVVAILNRFFDTVVNVVAAEGGFVNKFQGDGALCVFGAPLPMEDHAARGLRAAHKLAREIGVIGDISAAIGASSGQVVAGHVGTEDRYEFTVIGDPVNEASRLTDEAKLSPSRVLASERTINSAGDEASGWIRGEAIALRGRSQPTITYSPYD